MPTSHKQTLDAVVIAVARRRRARFSILLYGGGDASSAARRIAQAGETKLLRVNLRRVVSKYINETEKNLREIFSKAEDRDVLLFFDEADALFGQRSDVKDSHDRYANAETSYLLQRMEEHEGIVVLATGEKTLPLKFRRRFDLVLDLEGPPARKRTKKASIPATDRRQ